MDEDLKTKLEEISKKIDEEKRMKNDTIKKDADEKAIRDEEFRSQKEDILKEIKKELDEFEQMMLPLHRNLLDPNEFYTAGKTQFFISATENKRIEIFASGRMNGHYSIYSLADKTELQPYILDLLRFFLIRLRQFEKYYADRVEKYIK